MSDKYVLVEVGAFCKDCADECCPDAEPDPMDAKVPTYMIFKYNPEDDAFDIVPRKVFEDLDLYYGASDLYNMRKTLELFLERVE